MRRGESCSAVLTSLREQLGIQLYDLDKAALKKICTAGCRWDKAAIAIWKLHSNVRTRVCPNGFLRLTRCELHRMAERPYSVTSTAR